MSGGNAHEQARDDLASEALGILKGEERERLLAHVAECEACQRELAELRDAAAALAYLPPPRPMAPERSARLRERLLARATADSAPLPFPAALQAPQAATEPAEMLSPRGQWAGWLVAAGMAGLLASHHAFHRPLSGGWLAAGVFALLFIGVGAFAVVQYNRVARLGSKLRRLEHEREQSTRAPEPPHSRRR